MTRGRMIGNELGPLVVWDAENWGTIRATSYVEHVSSHLFFKSNKINVVILSMLWKMELLHIVLSWLKKHVNALEFGLLTGLLPHLI